MALLPVSTVVNELLGALQSAVQVMLHAPTGAGKSTWLPLEMRNSPGQTVGYRMRNESRCGSATRLEVVTEGILTRQLQHDPASGARWCLVGDPG